MKSCSLRIPAVRCDSWQPDKNDKRCITTRSTLQLYFLVVLFMFGNFSDVPIVNKSINFVFLNLLCQGQMETFFEKISIIGLATPSAFSESKFCCIEDHFVTLVSTLHPILVIFFNIIAKFLFLIC